MPLLFVFGTKKLSPGFIFANGYFRVVVVGIGMPVSILIVVLSGMAGTPVAMEGTLVGHFPPVKKKVGYFPLACYNLSQEVLQMVTYAEVPAWKIWKMRLRRKAWSLLLRWPPTCDVQAELSMREGVTTVVLGLDERDYFRVRGPATVSVNID